MAIDNALLKLENTYDVKKVTEVEEEYTAYQAGLRLGQASTGDVASLNIAALGTLIGTYDDTSFDNPVGTHPPGGITTVSVNLHQGTGIAEESNMTKPVLKRLADNDTHLRAADDSELTTIVDRLLGIVFVNDYPGTYLLASSSPGGDYTVAISNAFVDTRADGTTVNYSLYRRTAMTAPTKVSPVRLSNSKDGVRAMTSGEIQYSFGQRMKTRIMSSVDNIGSYQLRTSAQGVPIAAGTWVAKGIALDTKQLTADTDYTRVSQRTSLLPNNFADFIGNFLGPDYTGNFIADYTGNFLGDYVCNYIGNFLGNYVPNFTRTSTRTSTVNFTRTSTRTSTVNYTRTSTRVSVGAPLFTGNFAGNSTRTSTAPFGAFTGNFTGNFAGNSTRTSGTNYTGNYVGDYIGGNFVGNFVGDYIGGNFVGDYLGNYAGAAFTRESTVDFTRTSIGDFTRISQMDFTRISNTDFTRTSAGTFNLEFIGDYTGNYLGETIQAGNETIETWTLYVRTA